jgi:hypothetical protein
MNVQDDDKAARAYSVHGHPIHNGVFGKHYLAVGRELRLLSRAIKRGRKPVKGKYSETGMFGEQRVPKEWR